VEAEKADSESQLDDQTQRLTELSDELEAVKAAATKREADLQNVTAVVPLA
jgi:hypothetical protein